MTDLMSEALREGPTMSREPQILSGETTNDRATARSRIKRRLENTSASSARTRVGVNLSSMFAYNAIANRPFGRRRSIGSKSHIQPRGEL